MSCLQKNYSVQYVESVFGGEKAESYVTGRPDSPGPSCREVKNDVLQYFQTVILGLYVVSE